MSDLYANMCLDRRFHVDENITGYLKNHWTKHRLLCIHFDALRMLIPNMVAICNNFDVFDNFATNCTNRLQPETAGKVLNHWARVVLLSCIFLNGLLPNATRLHKHRLILFINCAEIESSSNRFWNCLELEPGIGSISRLFMRTTHLCVMIRVWVLKCCRL